MAIIRKDKPWAHLRGSRRQYEAARPWKRARFSREDFEQIVLALPVDMIDQILLHADDEKLIEAMGICIEEID